MVDVKLVARSFLQTSIEMIQFWNTHVPDKLQRVQNTAAHLVTRTRKFDSITLVLKQLL